MNVVLEDLFEPEPSEKDKLQERKNKCPTRSLFGNLSFSTLERSNSCRHLVTPHSPRSAMHSDDSEDDGVILTGNTRSQKMTRRHSMSRIFGTPSRNNSADSTSSRLNAMSAVAFATTTTETAPPTKFEQVTQMRPGLKRRQSLRKVLQPTCTPSESAVKPRLVRRNSNTSSPALGRSNSRRRLLQHTMSGRKQDSQRSLTYNGSNRSLNYTGHNSQRSIGSTQEIRMQRQSSLEQLMVDCNTTVSVSNTWTSVRQLPDYQKRLGEQIILKLIELDPLTGRRNMRLESFFSHRFQEICTTLVEMIDMIVTLLGPDLDEAGPELAKCGAAFRDQGIVTERLGVAVSCAVETLLGPEEITEEMVKAWKNVFDSLKRRLTKPLS